MWLPLLRRLTEASPTWVAWKNVDSALTGYGDVDSAAPPHEWPRLADEFSDWAFSFGLGPVVLCPHAPNLLHLVALRGEEPFFELDLVGRKVFLGSTLFVPADLGPVTEMDARGFRRVRGGAEGLIKLVGNGALRDGRPNRPGLSSKRIPELLAADPDGVRAAARLFGPAERSILELAEAVGRGSWNRRAMLSVEAWFAVRALKEPQSVAARLRFRRARRSCPVLRAVFSGRTVPGDVEHWVANVGCTHEIRRSRAGR
ncbi:MAG: hypothetical protein ACRDNK_03260 [Solirubrobacteraceae bacterium]